MNDPIQRLSASNIQRLSSPVHEQGFLFGDLTERIIGAAIEVHRSLGPGFIEAFYESAFAIELSHQGVPFRRQ
jgi:hypothetical protein